LTALRAVERLSIALALLATGCSGDDAPLEQSDRAVVAAIADGDSFRLEDGREVRLLQVDAPERGECHYDASARALAALLPRGRTVELESDPRLDARDDFGRLLRYVTADGADVNLRLVEQGAAAPYFFRGDRGRSAAELLAAAERARAARRGFWGACRDARLVPGLGAVTGRGR
jgi:endonuclease YncB( thermonuclease family)